MKHFQYSVMGHGILLRSLGWANKMFGEISFPPLAHPSSRKWLNKDDTVITLRTKAIH